MRRSCTTAVARAMGYLSHPSQEEGQFVLSSAKDGVIRSYHAGGVSNKDTYKASRQIDVFKSVRS